MCISEVGNYIKTYVTGAISLGGVLPRYTAHTRRNRESMCVCEEEEEICLFNIVCRYTNSAM